MNSQTQDPKALMEEGWKARENCEFEKSEELLTKTKELFESQSDFKNVTECLNHLAYLRRAQAFGLNTEAIKLAANSLELAVRENLDPTLCHRANSSILRYSGQFERAEAHTRKVVESMPSNPAARGEARGSLAEILMRRGKLIEAKAEIKQALKELEEGWEGERLPHKMIWKTKLLMTASLIDYNLGNKEVAKTQADEALSLAKEHNLKMRFDEANELLKLF